jgi:hypothetical protein
MLALVLPLTLCGCLLTTGQISIDFDLGTINVNDPDNLVAEQVDLNTISDYVDHKADISGLTDLAILGEVTNNFPTLTKGAGKSAQGGDLTLNAEAWITVTTTNYTTDAQVRASAQKLWGPFTVAPGATRSLDWDDSAALFSPAGKAILLNEVKGDGVFTIYVIGTSGFYNFTVDKATLVLTLEAKL